MVIDAALRLTSAALGSIIGGFHVGAAMLKRLTRDDWIGIIYVGACFLAWVVSELTGWF